MFSQTKVHLDPDGQTDSGPWTQTDRQTEVHLHPDGQTDSGPWTQRDRHTEVHLDPDRQTELYMDPDQSHLNLHALGLDDMDLVLVAAPHLVVDHGHAADGVVGAAQVHEVVVGQVPLPVCWGRLENSLDQNLIMLKSQSTYREYCPHTPPNTELHTHIAQTELYTHRSDRALLTHTHIAQTKL